MPTTMSKLLAMGMPLNEVIAASTHKAAAVIGKSDLGHIAVGAPADIAAFRLMEGEFKFGDSDAGTISAKRRLFCELTLRDGKVVWDWNARSGMDYKLLGPAYGVREGEFIVPPPKK